MMMALVYRYSLDEMGGFYMCYTLLRVIFHCNTKPTHLTILCNIAKVSNKYISKDDKNNMWPGTYMIEK